MNAFLIQILAMGMTVSQIFSKPIEQFKTHIDPQTGGPVATQLLKDGCGVLRTQTKKDMSSNIRDLLAALVTDTENERLEEEKKAKDPKAKAPILSGSEKLFKKVDFAGLLNAFKLFCDNDQSVADKINLVEVITYYNKVFSDLKDVNTLKNLKLGEATLITDGNGNAFNEMYGAGNRRLVVPIAKIPAHVKNAFVSAEDQNFYKHKGVDLTALVRAFTAVMGGGGGRPQGASTITQQVVKNMLINDDLTVERKMREMLLAARLEKIMTKDQILELYLNYVFLGRTSWGVEMAAKSYFGPKASVTTLTLDQAAMLAALTKGPSYYNPDRHPERVKDRRSYVLDRMRADCESCYSAAQISEAAGKPFQTVKFESPTTKGGFFFLDAVNEESKKVAKLDLKRQSSHNIQTTIHPVLQRATEEAVREGLMKYEANSGRKFWTGPQGSIANDVQRYDMKWQEVLPRVQPRLYDIPWTVAVVLDVNKAQVGLPGGQIVPLRGANQVLRKLKNYDLIFVDVTGTDKNQAATLKIPARAQGAAVVLENQTGRVLAITGGFSYASSEYNIALNGERQPGSTLKPFIYLAGLQMQFQPNTLLPDAAPNPPLPKWRPKNYGRESRGLVTFRTAVENSLNLPTVNLAVRLGDDKPSVGLDYVRSVFANMGIYDPKDQNKGYAEILGSLEARLIDMAAAYATVANSGLRPTPYFIDSISRNGQNVYTNKKAAPTPVKDIDRVSFYQLKRMLEGTLSRGTAIRMKKLEGFVAGKTGTSNNETDAWFICFTNDITIAVWTGYDNKKIHRNLGGGSTGGRVALPIAEQILKASFDHYKKPTKLNGPPDEIRGQIVEAQIDLKSGVIGAGNFTEFFRIDPQTKGPMKTQNLLLSRHEENTGVATDNENEDDEAEAVGGAVAPVRPVEVQPGAQVTEPEITTEIEEKPVRRPEGPPPADDNYQIWRNQPRVVDPVYQETGRLYYTPLR